METLDVKQRFIELRAKGWSFDKIAKELGKAKQTLLDWSKDLDLEIAQAKAIELETIYESYSLYKEARLKMIGGILSKIKEELDQRDLSDVPTDKLLDLLLKYEGVLKEMIVEPIFLSSKEMVEEREERNLLENLSSITAEGETLLKVG
jgi:transcriptional regulator with XRE-family HTH domain